jgi:enoyl-CoA hydratase
MQTFFKDSEIREYAGGKMLAARNSGIGLITFNQPEKRNAISVEMWAGLAEILQEFREDRSVRVLVLTGAGDKAFVSGADISQFGANRADGNADREYRKMTSAGCANLAAFPKPVIARIRGFCIGGGLAIAMQADLRIGSVDSRFGIPAARLSIAYGLAGTRTLVALVGPAHARMLLYTGTPIDAAEAKRIGLINDAVPAEELSAAVLKIAQTIAENAPLSVAASKLTINEILKDPADRDLAAVEHATMACTDSEDYRQGVAAFLEKRRPIFQGR